MSEFLITSDELAREFSADSAHIKRDRSDNPVTLGSLEWAAREYFRLHPEQVGEVLFDASKSNNPTPTPEEVQKGDYVVDKLSRVR